MEKKRAIDIKSLLPDSKTLEGARKRYKGIPDIPAEKVRLLQQGDHASFNSIYLTMIGGLTDYITSYVGCREDAQEIVQDVFEKVWLNHRDMDPERDLRALIFKMAAGKATDLLRRKDVRSDYERFEFSFDTADFAGDEMLISEETKLLIEATIQNMPEIRQRIFRMNREEGLTYEEIAEALGVSRSTVRNNISDAVKELQGVLAMIMVIFLNY